VAHRFWLLTTHDWKQEMVLQPHSPVTQGVCNFRSDKKGKVLSTDVIKVNDYFTLNDVALVDKRRFNLLSVSQLVDADLDVLFHECLIHLANLFVVFFALTKSFKLISHLLNYL
jgi:hypothetical protein